MDPTVCLALHHLRRSVLAARTTGRVAIEFATDRLRAASILMAVLHWDLETFTPLVPEAEAAGLVGRIFGQFPDDAAFLTSVRPHADTALSPHRWANGPDRDELDAGVAVVSAALVGLVWVEDRPRRQGTTLHNRRSTDRKGGR